MKKKYKPGENLLIGTKKYRVTRAKNSSLRCSICQLHNKGIPCFNPDPKLNSPSNEWSKKKCDSQLNADCYPYPL